MWSGPRNISTAMMRSFENRPDTAVWDEPYYAASLKATGLDHPMRDEILTRDETDPTKVAARVLGPVPKGRSVFYQKHMSHHMRDGFDISWIDQVRNAFLIRRPESVLASYVVKWEAVSLEDIGLPKQVEIFERIADKTGKAPAVIEGNDVLANPRRTLSALCAAVGIPFMDEMLSWPAGRRDSDGVWAPHWYHAVEASTEFGPPRPDVERSTLPLHLAQIAEAATPFYEKLAKYRI